MSTEGTLSVSKRYLRLQNLMKIEIPGSVAKLKSFVNIVVIFLRDVRRGDSELTAVELIH